MGLLRKRAHDLRREDRLYVGRTGDAMELQIVSATGSRLVDVKGRTHIDFESGWCVSNLGWNHPAIVERLRHFTGPSYVPPGMLYEPWVELAKRLAEVAPGKLSRSFRAVGGTEAVEIALQIAIAATDRQKVVSIENAYHGNSIAAHSIGEARSDVVLPGCKKLALPLDAKAVVRLETLLHGRDVACLIMEPVILNLAVELPTEDFLKGARRLCDRYGTLLVFDEVACGFGRTGRMFASEHSGVVPDIMTLAKAITNGHAPLAATITTPEIADMLDDVSFYSTFGWHPIAVEAALATLDIWRDEGTAILENVARRSGELVGALLAMDWRSGAEIRSKGLAIGVKLESEEYASQISERCRKRGLVLGSEEEHLVMYPPLILSDDDLRDAIEILQRCVGS